MDKEDLRACKLYIKGACKKRRKETRKMEKAREKRNSEKLCADVEGDGVATEAVTKGWVA